MRFSDLIDLIERIWNELNGAKFKSGFWNFVNSMRLNDDMCRTLTGTVDKRYKEYKRRKHSNFIVTQVSSYMI